MSDLTPAATTVRDICTAALKECGAIGVGQTPMAEDINDAWARMQWMLQQWQRKRWLVYHLTTNVKPSTGAQTYTVGPNGDFNLAERPDKIESGFLRQYTGMTGVAFPDVFLTDGNGNPIITQDGQNITLPGIVPIDYPLTLLQSMEDYNRIALKSLVSFPSYVYYDPAWPLGVLHLYPVAQANIYAIGLTIKEVLPTSFDNLSTTLSLPYEYYGAILYNLALRLRPKYQLPTFPGDPLVGMAKDALNVLRGANTAIATLQMPKDILRPGQYNIFSDQNY